jgi:hypothetical protein
MIYKHLLNLNILRIATTLSSFNISIEPRDIKYNEVKISPRCVIISPGGACVVFNFIENVRKQPSLASKRIQFNLLITHVCKIDDHIAVSR